MVVDKTLHRNDERTTNPNAGSADVRLQGIKCLVLFYTTEACFKSYNTQRDAMRGDYFGRVA